MVLTKLSGMEEEEKRKVYEKSKFLDNEVKVL